MAKGEQHTDDFIELMVMVMLSRTLQEAKRRKRKLWECHEILGNEQQAVKCVWLALQQLNYFILCLVTHYGIHGLVRLTVKKMRAIDHPLFQRQRQRQIDPTGLFRYIFPSAN